MSRGPRILVIGGTYRGLCLLEHLLERGERVVAFIGHEGGTERDFCPEILEICDRTSIPARSGRKLGEEIVRWLEDRIRPELAIAIGVDTEIPLAIGGNCRLGLLETLDRFQSESCPGVALRQRGQVVFERALPEPGPDADPGDAYLDTIDALLEAVDQYLMRAETSAAEPAVRVPFLADPAPAAAIEEIVERPEPGEETERLESEVARYLDAERVVALRSADDGFRLLYELLELRAGDEVICAPLGSNAALRALAASDLRPSWCDVEPGRATLDPDRIAEAVGPHTRALLVSHAFGQPAELGPLYALAEERGLELIEDGASALGARYGESRLGRAPCVCALSLPIAPVPSGRVCLVALPGELGQRFAALARPFRLGDGAARRARRELAGWEDRLAARRAHALAYSAELAPYDAFHVPPTPEDALPVYGQYLLRVTRFARTSADDLHKLLSEAGIETRRVAVNLPERELVRLPITEALRTQGVLLPTEAGLSEPQRERVLEAIFDYAIG